MREFKLALVVGILLLTPALAYATVIPETTQIEPPPVWVPPPAAMLTLGLGLSACTLAGRVLNKDSSALLYCTYGFLALTVAMS